MSTPKIVSPPKKRSQGKTFSHAKKVYLSRAISAIEPVNENDWKKVQDTLSKKNTFPAQSIMSIKNKFNQMVKERKEMMVQGVDENRLPVQLQYLAGIVDRINGKKNILIGENVKLTKFQTLELEDLVYDYTPVENDKWENIVSLCRFRWSNRAIQ